MKACTYVQRDDKLGNDGLHNQNMKNHLALNPVGTLSHQSFSAVFIPNFLLFVNVQLFCPAVNWPSQWFLCQDGCFNCICSTAASDLKPVLSLMAGTKQDSAALSQWTPSWWPASFRSYWIHHDAHLTGDGADRKEPLSNNVHQMNHLNMDSRRTAVLITTT